MAQHCGHVHTQFSAEAQMSGFRESHHVHGYISSVVDPIERQRLQGCLDQRRLLLLLLTQAYSSSIQTRAGSSMNLCIQLSCCGVLCCLAQVPDPMARYKQLLFYAAKLPAMSAEQHKPENKVEGCVSQVRMAVFSSCMARSRSASHLRGGGAICAACGGSRMHWVDGVSGLVGNDCSSSVCDVRTCRAHLHCCYCMPACCCRCCVCCQVWVVPELRDDGCIYWTADSDSQLTKVGGAC